MAAYVRKTEDVYNVEGNYGYGYGWEVVCASLDRKEARADLRAHRDNEPGVPFRITKRRERKEGGA